MAKTCAVQLRTNIPQVTARARREIAKEVERAAESIVQRAQADMAQPKHGRIYRRPGGRLHQASAPGESPAIDYGRLVRSFSIRKVGELLREIVVPQPGFWLEFGTRRMAARPFLRPSVEAERPRFFANIREILRWGAR